MPPDVGMAHSGMELRSVRNAAVPSSRALQTIKSSSAPTRPAGAPAPLRIPGHRGCGASPMQGYLTCPSIVFTPQRCLPVGRR